MKLRCRAPSRRRLWPVLAVFGCVFGMVGCATVPTTGPVEHHSPQAAGVDSAVRVDPLPPWDGASQLLVVEGFLHAMSAYQPNYEIARQYLTPAASTSWHPESGVQIYADGFPPTETEQSVVLSVRLTGRLDAAGTYYPVGSDAPVLKHDFGLVKNDAGQWRISDPPSGLLVSRYAFTTGFTAVNLHFLDPAGSVLVPDPRFFASGDQAVKAAAEAQLAGPSAWLAPAVRKTVTGTVTVSSVVLDDAGVAEVELSNARELDADQRTRTLAELTNTLIDFAQVTAVQVAAEGEVWRDSLGQTVVRPDSFPQLLPAGGSARRSLFVIKNRKVQRLKDLANWNDLSEVSVPLTKPERFAVNGNHSEVTATTLGGTKLQTGRVNAGKAATVRSGKGLLRPEYTRFDELWSPASAGLAQLQVFQGDRRLKVVNERQPVPKLGVKAIALSPDGVRVALILTQGGRTRLGLARLQRSEGQVTVSGWNPLSMSLVPGGSGAAIDVGWVTGTELVVVRGNDVGTSVVRVSQDGATSADIGPSENTSMSQLAVAPLRPIAALGPSGDLYRRDGEFDWNLAITSVDAVAYSAQPVDG